MFLTVKTTNISHEKELISVKIFIISVDLIKKSPLFVLYVIVNSFGSFSYYLQLSIFLFDCNDVVGKTNGDILT